MKAAAGPFGAQLKALREAAGFTQEELATIAGLSVHAVSALERGERRRPHVETVRALSAALDLTGVSRDALIASARVSAQPAAADELSGAPLPLPPTALLGREADLHTLQQWLGDPDARLVTILGPGGVGKTRLALELARGIADEGSTAVAFVSLVAIREPAFVASAIAEAFGVANVTALDLPKRARAVCADRRMLLVLDNFEQVLDAAPLVAELLSSVASLRLLATSRAPLRVRGEREYVVEPLALAVDPETLSPADLARAPAVRLFVERARDVQPDFRLTTRNSSAVLAICRRLDALPLALELAAPWIKVLAPEQLLRRLADDVLLSTVGPRDLPERQQTMNATVAWSYQLLGPTEQRVFRRLAALPGRFGMDAAAAVLGGDDAPAVHDEVLGAVAGLIDKSLLLRADGSLPGRPLYQMLEAVRAFAALELAASGERDTAMDGLARYCVAEAARAAEGLVEPAQIDWLDRVRHDLDNYRSAMSWLIEGGRAGDASAIASALRYFWLIRGHAAEGLRWYGLILDMPSLSTEDESRTLVGASALWFAQGEIERARVALDRALALARSANAREIIADAEYTSGHVERVAGNTNVAHDLFTRSLEGYRTLHVPGAAGKVLTGMASMALAAGDDAAAARLLDEAASALGDDAPWFLCFVLCMRALLALRRGNADETIAWARESLVRIRAFNDRFVFVYALVPLAAGAALKGNDEWAARVLGVRDAVAERTGATLTDRTVHGFRVRAEQEVRERLGPDRWALAYAAGRKSSIDALMKDIDRVLAKR
jgi:predicted ATPase/DNA-binding XRE family transcriptional regulator